MPRCIALAAVAAALSLALASAASAAVTFGRTDEIGTNGAVDDMAAGDLRSSPTPTASASCATPP